MTNDENSNFNTDEISYEDFFKSRMNVEHIVDVSVYVCAVQMYYLAVTHHALI